MTQNLTLLTDLYQFTMAQGYWETGYAEADACFYMHFRENPFKGGYAVACGMAQLADLIEGFAFTREDIEYLATLPASDGSKLFKPAFLESLLSIQLTVDVDAVEEGTIVFPYEPLVRVTGPILQCQLIETALLNCINFETLVATKAARVCQVAEGPVAEFGLRRAQGPNGANLASRAAVVGGCASTSNVLAGKLYGLPVSGTHAHSWVMAFESELEAFRAFAWTMPQNCTLLVDTYDTIRGVKNAIIVAHEMEQRGHHLAGIRIDSGDLAWFSQQARALLDEAQLSDVKIVASNDLDEYTISSLKTQNARIDAWGVGTKLATAYDQAALGGVYKLAAIRHKDAVAWDLRLKLSEQASKLTIPGILDTRRYTDDQGIFVGDMVFDVTYPTDEQVMFDPVDDLRRKNLVHYESSSLLKPLARQGQVVLNDTNALRARDRTRENLAHLHPSIKRFLNPHVYPVGLEQGLHRRREDLVLAARGFSSEQDGPSDASRYACK